MVSKSKDGDASNVMKNDVLAACFFLACKVGKFYSVLCVNGVKHIFYDCSCVFTNFCTNYIENIIFQYFCYGLFILSSYIFLHSCVFVMRVPKMTIENVTNKA